MAEVAPALGSHFSFSRKCIRRTSLDAIWSREPSTVRSVLDKGKKGLAIATALWFAHSLFRPWGPFPVIDNMGMGVAVGMLQHSLHKGRYNHTLQYKTICKFQAAASNIFHSLVDSQGAIVMVKDTRKLQVTSCPTYSEFFELLIRVWIKGWVMLWNRTVQCHMQWSKKSCTVWTKIGWSAWRQKS